MANLLDSSNLFLKIALFEEVSQGFQKGKLFLNQMSSKTVNSLTKLTNKSLNTVSETVEKTNNYLNENVGRAVSTVTSATGKAVNTVAEVTDKAKGSVTEVAAKATDMVAEKTNAAIYSVTQTAEQASYSLSQTATKVVDNLSVASGKAVNTISETAKQAEGSILETFEKSKNSLEDTIQKAEQLSNAASTAIEKAVNEFINHRLDTFQLWIDAHPSISWTIKSLMWGVNHPIYSIVIILLTIFIIWQFIKAFSRLIEKSLLLTLTVPFKLVQSLFKFNFKPLNIFKDNSILLEKQKYQRLREIFAQARMRYLEAGGDPRRPADNRYLTDEEKKEAFELGAQVFNTQTKSQS